MEGRHSANKKSVKVRVGQNKADHKGSNRKAGTGKALEYSKRMASTAELGSIGLRSTSYKD